MTARPPVVLAGLGAAAAAAAAWMLWWEPRRARLHEVELELPRWPADLDGLRVAVMSDLHTGAPYVDPQRVERLVREVNAARPDLVALLGDYVDPHVRGGSYVAPQAVARALAGLRARLAVVAVLGNHDWVHTGTGMEAALRDAGLQVLENDALEVAPSLWVAGVADASVRRPLVAATLEKIPDHATVLLLSHDPDVFPQVPERVALTLSGHTHGGQADVPLVRARVIPSRHGTRFKDGHIVEEDRHLFVSRGIGTSRLPLRLNAPPEVPILRLRAGSQARER